MEYRRGCAVLSGEVEGPAKPRLLDEVRRLLRVKHYSLSSERAYPL